MVRRRSDTLVYFSHTLELLLLQRTHTPSAVAQVHKSSTCFHLLQPRKYASIGASRPCFLAFGPCDSNATPRAPSFSCLVSPEALEEKDNDGLHWWVIFLVTIVPTRSSGSPTFCCRHGAAVAETVANVVNWRVALPIGTDARPSYCAVFPHPPLGLLHQAQQASSRYIPSPCVSMLNNVI
jgi:hypothetical protein